MRRADVTRDRRRPWPVAAVNGSVAIAVLVLVAVLALVVQPPTPPGIAAFAPQASKPITKAPLAQSAVFGNGAGQCSAGQVCAGVAGQPRPTARALPTPRPTPQIGYVPSALQCYTWPDGSVTQTFDPQSPPCIASWDDRHGNGGATAPGITATEIRVAFPNDNTSSLATWPALSPIVDFFNTHFELYGRKIRIVPFISAQANGQALGTSVDNPTSQHADAEQITQLKVFASTDFVDPVPHSWSLPVFRDVLTQHKIISVSGGANSPYGDVNGFAAHAPYEWTYYPTIDPLMANVATMTCRQLVGKLASHSQDTLPGGLASKTRKFAVLLPTDAMLGGPPPGLSTMLGILDGCGVHNPRIVRYAFDSQSAAALSAEFNQMHQQGVTSLLYFPYVGNGSNTPLSVAAQVNYDPEWVTIGWNKYLTEVQLGNPETETKAVFGVGAWNKMPDLALEFWYQSYLQAGGRPDVVAAGALEDGRAFYNEMLLLASAVQMAGPDLTPESFARALTNSSFPDPGAGGPPSYQGGIGFGPGQTAMIDDYVGFWLDTRETWAQLGYHDANYGLNSTKASCYVGLGRRWQQGTWPATDAFYTPGCR